MFSHPGSLAREFLFVFWHCKGSAFSGSHQTKNMFSNIFSRVIDLYQALHAIMSVSTSAFAKMTRFYAAQHINSPFSAFTSRFLYFFRKFSPLNFEISIYCSTFALAKERWAHFSPRNGALVQLVRIHACHAWGHGFESRTHRSCENSSVGRARPCQGRGRGFEPRFSLKILNAEVVKLVDTLLWGGSGRSAVWVRVSSSVLLMMVP